MDPVTALGAVAATIQLTEFSLKVIFTTIKFLKDLESQPHRVGELLGDIEKSVSRMVSLQASLKDGNSKLPQRLTPDQVIALDTSIDDGLKAAGSLTSLLSPVFKEQKAHSKRKLMWKMVISKTLESEIEEHLTKIQRHNDLIMNELQRSGLDIHLQIADTLDRTLAAVEKTMADEQVALSKLQALEMNFEEETRKTAVTAQEIQRLLSEAETIGTTTQRTSAEVQSLRDMVMSQQKDTVKQIKNDSSSAQQQIMKLRDEILALLIGQQASLTELMSKDETLKLAEQHKRDLLAELRKELITHPSTMRRACDTQVSQLESSSVPWDIAAPCFCRSHRNTRSMAFGFLSFYYETRNSHSATCQETHMRSTSQKFRLALQLLPFLNKTVELTFGATFFGGGFHVETPLRLFGTVQRSQSYMFQLFDSFPEACNAVMKGSPQADSMWRTEGTTFDCYEWDVGRARFQLQQLYRSLLEMERQGSGSLRDRDEYGHTFLHEMIILIGLLAPVYAALVSDIDSLLLIAERAGVDVEAIAQSTESQRKLIPFELVQVYELQSFGTWTVSIASRKITKMFHHQFQDFSFLGRLSRFCHLDFEEFDKTPGEQYLSSCKAPNEGLLPSNLRVSLIKCLTQEPWLTEYFYDDELPLLLSGRNIHKLESLLPKLNLDSRNLGLLPLNALDLACGWPEGLRLLSTVWKDGIARTANLMATAQEYDSLRVLCDFQVPLFKDSAEMIEYMTPLFRNGTILLDALLWRRYLLAEFAKRHLPMVDLIRFNLTDDRRSLDAQAYAVFQLLKDRGFDVPDHLNPGPPASVYSFAVDVFLGHHIGIPSWNSLLALVSFYDGGFCDIDDRQNDDQNGSACTPLERIISGLRIRDAMWAPICAWFLRMGASASFAHTCKIKNILFGIAGAIAQYEEAEFLQLYDDKPTAALLKYAVALFSPLETDDCECFCSSSGCLPIHHLLRGPVWALKRRCHKHQGFRICIWMWSCDMSNIERELSLEEAVRLEVFNRLEMTHTCCRRNGSMTSEERVQIRTQEEGKRVQLDIIMSAYVKSRDSSSSHYPDNPPIAPTSACDCLEEERTWPQYFYMADHLQWHWTKWWSKAIKILPIDMTLEDEPAQFCLQHRFAEIRARILRQQGYEDMDFTTVIQHHFEDELKLEPCADFREAREPFVAKQLWLYLDLALFHTCLDHGYQPWDWLAIQLAPSDDGSQGKEAHASEQVG
ncbi:hypothetical protein B0I35DRAFT_117345 [Stachybotrys elegans]|uniref:Fungal N-terminal domain-containing protein n=1 Tax=Stachybotrys elegans TaxID=80388 RepID=A0A8K0T3A8_9HYPO|nr:hypothetical protein B0I35DRAFT_117345 [Stachybotrys elegans]